MHEVQPVKTQGAAAEYSQVYFGLRAFKEVGEHIVCAVVHYYPCGSFFGKIVDKRHNAVAEVVVFQKRLCHEYASAARCAFVDGNDMEKSVG